MKEDMVEETGSKGEIKGFEIFLKTCAFRRIG